MLFELRAEVQYPVTAPAVWDRPSAYKLRIRTPRQEELRWNIGESIWHVVVKRIWGASK